MGINSNRFLLEKLAGLLVLGFFLFRIANPADIPFILDEPHLQLILDEHFSKLTLPIHGLDGSQGQAYGPVPLWIYAVIRIFTNQVITIGILHNLIFTFSLLIGFYFSRRHFGRGADIWFVLLGLMSPLLTFYSRLPWDNTFQFSLSLVLIWFTFSKHPKKHFYSGIASGMLFSTHLMSIPIIAVSALYKERTLKNLTKRAGGFLIPTIVYLPGLVRGIVHGNPRQPIPWWDALRQLPRDFLGGFQSLSMTRMKYFAPETLGDFFRSAPFDIFWIVLPLIIYFGYFKTKHDKSILNYFSICLIAHALFFFILKIDASHPHYFMPVFSIALLFTSELLARTFKNASLAFRPILVSLMILMLGQLTWTQWTMRHTVLENGGMRDLHIGPSVASVQALLQSMCLGSNDNELKISMAKMNTVFPISLEYQFKHQPACFGKTLKFDPSGPLLEFDSSTPQSARLSLRKS